MSKPTTYLMMAALLLVNIIFLSSCQGQTPSTKNSATVKTLSIATSFYPMYIATINIAKDVPDVKVFNITQPTTGCLHDYQLRPGDLKIISEAKVLVINGAGMESFIDKVLQQQPNLKIVEASKGIPLIKGNGGEGDNPHVWVSISNAIQQVKNIGQQLAEIDPDHAAQYSLNTTVYVDKLEALRVKMHQSLDGAKKKDIITFHEAFPYFALEFNLNIIAVIEREPGNVKALFAEPQYPGKAADTIARETGAKVFTLDPVVTGLMEPDAYLKTMESNMKVLVEALN